MGVDLTLQDLLAHLYPAAGTLYSYVSLLTHDTSHISAHMHVLSAISAMHSGIVLGAPVSPHLPWAKGSALQCPYLHSTSPRSENIQQKILQITQVLNNFYRLGIYNPSTQRAEVGRSLQVSKKPGLQTKLKNSPNCTVRPCLEKTKNKEVNKYK